jgi:hypothetical protein
VFFAFWRALDMIWVGLFTVVRLMGSRATTTTNHHRRLS